MQSLFSNLVPATPRPKRPAPVAGPIDAAPLLMAPQQVVSRYTAERALAELYPAHPSARTLARAAELLELPFTHPAVQVAYDAAHDLSRILRFRGRVTFDEVQRLALVVVEAK